MVTVRKMGKIKKNVSKLENMGHVQTSVTVEKWLTVTKMGNRKKLWPIKKYVSLLRKWVRVREMSQIYKKVRVRKICHS